MFQSSKAVNTYGLSPIGRLTFANWMSKIVAGPPISDAELVRALLDHANATPHSVEHLFHVRAGVPFRGNSSVRGQQWPDKPKKDWIAKWRQRLAQIIDDPENAVLVLFPATKSKLETGMVSKPEFILIDGQLERLHRLVMPDTDLAMEYAVMLLLTPSLGYGERLSHCRYRECRRFFLTERKGGTRGPMRRLYCSDEHRTAEHALTVTERVRKHRRQKMAKKGAPRRKAK